MTGDTGNYIDIFSLNPLNGTRETISQVDYEYDRNNTQKINDKDSESFSITVGKFIVEVGEILDIEVTPNPNTSNKPNLYYDSSDLSVARVNGDKLVIVDYGTTIITGYDLENNHNSSMYITTNTKPQYNEIWYTTTDGNIIEVSSIEVKNNKYYSNEIGVIKFPENITSIGDSAFSYCTSLTSITSLNTTPPTQRSNVFSGCSNLSVIYVPLVSVDLYKTASGWNSYASKIQAIN